MQTPPNSGSGSIPDFDPNTSALKRFAAIKDLGAQMYKEENPSKREALLDQINRDIDEILLLINSTSSDLEDIQLVRNNAYSVCHGKNLENRKADFDYLCRAMDTLTTNL